MLRLARLLQSLRIANPDGTPTREFLQLFNVEFAAKIEANEAAQALALEQIRLIQAQQSSQLELINQALQLAGLAVGGTSAESLENIDSLGWTLGPQVDLTGVVAGDLTITGTSLQGVSTTRLSVPTELQDGQLRIVEVVGGVDTVVGGPWLFQTFRDENPNSVPAFLNPPEIASFTAARTTTGAVSYRMDTIMDVNPIEMVDVRHYLLVKRS